MKKIPVSFVCRCRAHQEFSAFTVFIYFARGAKPNSISYDFRFNFTNNFRFIVIFLR